MFYAVTDTGVETGLTLQKLNKKLNSKLEKENMKKIGSDYVITLSNSDLQFIQDKKTMSKIPIQKLYKKGNEGLLIYIMLGLQLILLIKG